MGKYMTYAELKKTAYALLDDKINEVFYELQTNLDISSGDIFPDEAFKLDDMAEKLSDYIADVVMGQYNSEEDFMYMINTLVKDAGLDISFVENIPLDDVEQLYIAYDGGDPGVFDDLIMRYGG